MGGTTAKGSLVLDHQTLKAYELEAARVHHFKKGSGLLIKTPVIDLIEIGSGGGSLAEVDERGMIRVGPVSAGAKPGPVCYGQGGTRPTLTDANLVLGYLDADYFLGGTMKIDRAAAGRAIEEHIAAPLGIDLIRAAWGIHEVANEDVARSFRLHASERGTDYRSASMVAFGGSGPAHAIRIARKLKMSRLVFPPGAGVMSAFGMLVSPLSFEVIRSHRSVLGALTSESQREFFASLEKEATDVLLEAGIPREDMHISRRLDMRYEGQGYEIEIPLDSLGESDLSASKIADLFVSEYSRIFSRPVPDRGLEIINWKLTATGKEPLKLTRENLKRYAGGSGIKKRVRTAYDPDAGEMVPFNIYDRYSLRPGDQLDGPSIVEEKEATCVIGGNANVYVDEFLNLVAEF